ncbi:MAG: dihydroorotase [Clostridiales bacterium]|nr:dihydroorotase [Clostridiales bacterium]
MMILLKHATVVNKDGMQQSDVLIDEGVIKLLAPNIEYPSAEIIDCDGKLVFPGFIDMHCHLRDPGQTHKEDIESGSLAALAGGFTTVCCMPNTVPPLDNPAMVGYVREKSGKAGNADVFPVGCITRGQKGVELCEYGKMKQAGAIAVSDDGVPVASGAVMLNALKYAKTFNIPLLSHSEDKSISAGGVVNDGDNATICGLRGIPRSAESAAVARDVLLAEEAGARIHICHVSTAESVDIIRAAKARGVQVTCETCPHYFAATDDEILSYNTNAKINPPLREEADVEAIVEGIKDGTIDVIATDHAPHGFDEKNVEFDYAPFGTVGLETAFSLAYTYLVLTDTIKPSDLCRLMSYEPSRILGLTDRGRIEQGARADIVIIDPDAEYVVDAAEFKSKGKNSLFDGWRLNGKITQVIVKGELKAL